MSKLVDIETIHAEIEKRMKIHDRIKAAYYIGARDEDKELLKWLDKLPEEKPIDLEKEIQRVYYEKFEKGWSFETCAEHFYNLGRMAKMINYDMGR